MAAQQNSAKMEIRNGAINSHRPTMGYPSSLMESSGYIGANGCGSGRNLELVSKESFQQRLEGMSSSCLDCLAERRRDLAINSGMAATTTTGMSTHRLQKANRVKRNSPIVVCLRDSIRLAEARSRARSSVTHANISQDRRTNNCPKDDQAKSQEEKFTCLALSSSASVTSTSSVVQAPSSIQMKTEKGSKNFNAFLSAIEKVHTKTEKPRLSEQNLDRSSGSNASICPMSLSGVGGINGVDGSSVIRDSPPAETVLNNATFVGQADVSLTADAMRTSFTEKDNVDIICNDLHSSSLSTQAEVLEESDHSDGSSCHPFSSDSSDAEVEGMLEEEEELSKEELDRLSEHTVGFAMRHYELPPNECPECLSAHFAYTHYYAQGSKFFKIEVLDRDDELYNSYSTPDSMPDSVFEYPPADVPSSSSNDAKGKLKVNHIGQPHQQSLPPFTFHRHIDTVSLDLTGSNVTFTVEQHPVDMPTPSAGEASQGTSEPQGPGEPEFYHNFYCTMFGFFPCVPGYCFIPAFYFMFPMWSIPKAPVVTANQPPRDKLQPKIQELYAADPSSFVFRPGPVTPPKRPWISLNQPDVSMPVAIYTVMCYNVLCDKYATRQLYGYCPSWALNWEFRKKNIFEEIHQYSADIINLQEVETEQFYNFFLPKLKAEGYEGIFSPKSRARTMTEADRKHVDGCAIFFKHSKFSLIKEHLVEFNQVAIETAEGSEDMINRVMTKDNIGLAALLETKANVWENGIPTKSAQLLLVATCHIHWDPECCDVKLIQTMMLMNKLKSIMEETQATLRHGANSSPLDCNSIPLILCGDLNSLPDSGVVEYLSLGKISANHRDFKDIGYEDSLRKLSSSGSKDAYSHAFRLSQAYSSDVMPYTNYTCDFKGTIDYVFYSRDCIRPLGILGPLDQEWFHQNQVLGCPNPQVPSDHLPLLVEFEMHMPLAPVTALSIQSATTTLFTMTAESGTTSAIPASATNCNSKGFCGINISKNNIS